MRIGADKFAETIRARLAALDTSVFAAETAAGLPPDAIRNVLRTGQGKAGPTLARASEICDALGLEFYIGPPRDAGPVSITEIDGEVYAAVPRYDAQLAAGAGRQNPDQAAVGAIAFRRDWLNREGIAPGQAMVLGVCGDSMAPTLCDGDLVMIDRRKTAPVNRRIYALIGPGDEARVKRVERLPAALLLHSDNEDFPTEIIAPSDANRIRILGEVVWWGHTVKDS